MTTEEGRERSGSQPPFDSLAGLRALGEVQRRGLEAANQVVSRLVAQPGADPGPQGAANGADPVAQFVAMTEAWMNALSSMIPGDSPNGSAAAPEGIAADPLVMPHITAGTCGTGEFWLHNNSGASVSDVRLHCGDLRSHSGWALQADNVSFEPAEIRELPDRSSRGITLAVDVPTGTPPDVYRGSLLASNLPEVWLPIEVRVTGPNG